MFTGTHMPCYVCGGQRQPQVLVFTESLVGFRVAKAKALRLPGLPVSTFHPAGRVQELETGATASGFLAVGGDRAQIPTL